MTKRLFLLGGLAILAVVLSHAAAYAQTALFLWADKYLPVSVPNWNALDSVSHYGLLVLRSTCAFAVPAFLFVSGFFSAYTVRGNQPTSHRWKAVFRRVLGLVIPYLFWSIVIFVGQAFTGTVYAPLEYVIKLLTGGAFWHLFFVPVLCCCYLLSPWIVVLARSRPRLLISALVLLQVGLLASEYARLFGVGGTALAWIGRVAPEGSLLWWIIFFALGSVAALNIEKVKEWLTKYRWQIVAVAVFSWLLNIWEGNVLLRTYRTEFAAGIGTVSCNLYAVSVVACFLSFWDAQIPWSKALQELSKRSYGIYLVHFPIIHFVAYFIRTAVPGMLANQALLVLLFFIVGLGGALLIMEAVDRWPPSRRVYRYLFG
jgi:surface polysaccharide O-acyltransferase-like enzyme